MIGECPMTISQIHLQHLPLQRHLGLKQQKEPSLSDNSLNGDNKESNPLRFQGSSKLKRLGFLSMAIMTLGMLVGCDNNKDGPQPNVHATSDWHALGKSVELKSVTIDGKKMLLVDGDSSVATVLFPNIQGTENTGLTYESGWFKQGNSTNLKIIEFDGQRFVITDGNSGVDIIHLDINKPEASAGTSSTNELNHSSTHQNSSTSEISEPGVHPNK